MNWQPIETAPKDGTQILAFCPDEEPTCVVVEWLSDDHWSGWVFTDEVLSDISPEGPNPTNWMPLPSPPDLKG